MVIRTQLVIWAHGKDTDPESYYSYYCENGALGHVAHIFLSFLDHCHTSSDSIHVDAVNICVTEHNSNIWQKVINKLNTVQ